MSSQCKLLDMLLARRGGTKWAERNIFIPDEGWMLERYGASGAE